MKTGWILEANFKATEIEILKESGDTAIVKIKGGEGGFRIRKNRIYKTKEECLKSIKDNSYSKSGHGAFGH
ncbi:MAG: hypothetical protein IJQ67_01365 [Bacilli bacterium]|nr:hypothetical protein [Bacilli bacterium]